MAEHLVAIGHIVEDTAEPVNVIGGGVTYSGITARSLGLEVDVVTKVPPGHRFISTLNGYGIGVLNLPSDSNAITAFTNTYDHEGRRQQVLKDRQETITALNLIDELPDYFPSPYFLVAPVIGEVETRAMRALSIFGSVAVTPQGYFRQTGEDGVVFQKEWSGFEKHLAFSDLTVLSEEDISAGRILNQNLFERIKEASNITVLTRGGNGATVYFGNDEFDVKALTLSESEARDFTGAGDTYAAALIVKLMGGYDLHDAAVFASFVAGLKIMGEGGSGIDSIPDLDQIRKFLDENPKRTDDFLRLNDTAFEVLKV